MRKSPSDKDYFHFKKFSVKQDVSPMKVNTDGVLLGAWSDVSAANRVLEIGAGTGFIALMLAQKNPSLMIDAIDINEAACTQASANFYNTPLGKNIHCIHKSFQDFQAAISFQYDLIVSNPPFFTSGIPTMGADKAAARHAVQLTHLDIIHGVKKLLSTNGFLDIILPYAEGQQFISFSNEEGLFLHSMVEVFSRSNKPSERLLMRFSTQPAPLPICMKLVIMHANTNEYSLEFCQLTRDFYLFM